MIWTGALIVFIVQILCCIHARGRFLKYLPTAIPAAILAAALFGSGFSVATVLWLTIFGSVVLGGLFAIGLYLLVK